MYLRIDFFILTFIWILMFSNSSLRFNNPEIANPDAKPFSKNYLPTHSTKEELVKYAGFTLCYNEEHEQAKWVAYRLTTEMCENSTEERTNNFKEDENIKTQSASPDDYKKSGYDRGHLCPAGDMGWSEQTMNQSFLMSNMSPQLPKFNRGIWKNLESKVRDWTIKNEEIFIVTAGVLKGKLKVIGKNKVTVPNYFYKVILDYRLPEYKAIAFVMPNKSSKKSIFCFAVNIDSVERLTGIDFFPALKDSIENILESELDIKKWQ